MSNKQTVQQHFAATAESYRHSPIHAQGADLAWLVQAAGPQGQERVLDIGTGAGHAAFAFAPYVAAVEGIDITPAMLAQAELGAEERGLENVRFGPGDAEAIPRPDEHYDIVVSRWCAHHYQHLRQALAEVARVLKPGGQFLLVDSYVPHEARLDTFINALELLRDSSHVRNYSIDEWLNFTERVGLHGEVLHEWPLRLHGEDWVARIQTPAAQVTAIRGLLQAADLQTAQALNITPPDHREGWGFDLPALLLRASKLNPQALLDD
jgi:ubiquinone/menaquinone biosynthesis C-methylase UbiE